MSEPLSCEAMEPGEAGGAESITDIGEGIGDAAICASWAMCCCEALESRRHHGCPHPLSAGLGEKLFRLSLPSTVSYRRLG